MKIFASPVDLPGLATAELARTEKKPRGIVGIYTLQPLDPVAFVSRFGDSQPFFRRMYDPAPGLWASYVLAEGEDELELHVGLDNEYGKALLEAHQRLKGSCDHLVPSYQVQALAMGFLDKAGV